MQRRFWHAALGVGAFFSAILSLQFLSGMLAAPATGYVLRVAGAYVRKIHLDDIVVERAWHLEEARLRIPMCL